MHTARWSGDRGTSLAAGVLFLVTFVTGILAWALYQPLLDDPAGYIAGAGEDGKIYSARRSSCS